MPAEHTASQVSPDTAELARLRAELTELLDDLNGTPCSFWACHGVTDEIVPMATCSTCAAQIRIRDLLAGHADTPEGEASPGTGEPEPLAPELVINHDRYFATWPAGSRRVAVYADAADWAAGNEPVTELAVPAGIPPSPGYFAALMRQWMAGATFPPVDEPG